MKHKFFKIDTIPVNSEMTMQTTMEDFEDEDINEISNCHA